MTVFVCAIPVLAHGVQKKERKRKKNSRKVYLLFFSLY